jgi:hypothetical protein
MEAMMGGHLGFEHYPLRPLTLDDCVLIWSLFEQHGLKVSLRMEFEFLTNTKRSKQALMYKNYFKPTTASRVSFHIYVPRKHKILGSNPPVQFHRCGYVILDASK